MSNNAVYIDRTHNTDYTTATMPAARSPAVSPATSPLSPGQLTRPPGKTPARGFAATEGEDTQAAYQLIVAKSKPLLHTGSANVAPVRADSVTPQAQQWCALDSVQRLHLSPSCYHELERMLPASPAGFNTDIAIHSAEMAVAELAAHTLPSTTSFVSVSTTADNELCLRSVSGQLSVRSVLPAGLFHNHCRGHPFGNVVDTVFSVESTLDNYEVDDMTSIALLSALVHLEKLPGEWAVKNMHVEAYALNVDLPQHLTKDSEFLSTSHETLQHVLRNEAVHNVQQKAALAALPVVAMHLRKWVQSCNTVLTKSGLLLLQTRPLTSADIATKQCKVVQTFSTTLYSLCKLARVLETTYPPELRHVNLTDYKTIEHAPRGKVIGYVDALVSTKEDILMRLDQWREQATALTVPQDMPAFAQVQYLQKMSVDPAFYVAMHAHKQVGEWHSAEQTFAQCAFAVADLDDYVGPQKSRDRFAFAFELAAMTRLGIGEPTDVTLVPTTTLHDVSATVVRQFNLCVCNDANVARVPGGRVQLHNSSV